MKLDLLNSFLILLSFLVAFSLPFDLLIYAYAFLGPLHYLTEVSWLHDKNYYCLKKTDVLFFLVLIALVFLRIIPNELFILLSLGWAIASTSFQSHTLRLMIMSFVSGLFLLFYDNQYLTLLGILVPTIVHVLLFTFIFMLVGAIYAKSKIGLVNAWSFLVLFFVLIFIKPITSAIQFPLTQEMSLAFFRDVQNAFLQIFSIETTDQNLVGVFAALSFAYTYHYLNWFTKAPIISWHKVNFARFGIILLAYLFSIGLYLTDFTLGFSALLVLSVSHVILEFPLNVISIKKLCVHIRSPQS